MQSLYSRPLRVYLLLGALALYYPLVAMAAVSVYSLAGVSGLGGRLLLGVLADRLGAKPVLVAGLMVQALGADSKGLSLSRYSIDSTYSYSLWVVGSACLCRQPYCDMGTVLRSGLALPTGRRACPANGIFAD